VTFEATQMNVIRWSEDRKIIPRAKPHTQLMKAVSEMGELCDAELKGDIDAIEDGVGDVLVCLINYCALKEIDLVSCLQGAYDEIKGRSGTLMPNGLFVKD
jgi:NTP pyrophosphatase (non-canonical NTP hydrolase)